MRDGRRGLIVDLDITVWCEKIKPGCEFFARAYDRQTSQFFGGSGATALEAIAWTVDEYLNRGVLKLGPRMARNSNEQPGDTWRAA